MEIKKEYKYMQLEKIQFPVYKIGTDPVNEEDDMIFTESYGGEIKIIDDKSVEGDSLALRRLKLKNRGANLRPLSLAIFFLADLVKLSNPNVWFIDSLGQPFRYIKSKLYPLVCKKITKVKEIPTGGALIEVEGYNNRFKVLHTPDPNSTHAGIILIGMGALLYGLYPGEFKATRRKV